MEVKPIIWIASSKNDLRFLPEGIQDEMGHALYQAQKGLKNHQVKSLKGFGGASVLEVVENDTQGTYRVVYTVKFKEAIAVLHVFQKKSKQGIATPKQDLELIRARLKVAENFYESWLQSKKDLCKKKKT